MKVPVILYAPAAAGKSILLHHFAYDFLGEGNALYVDTEGGAEQMLNLWRPILDQRYGMTTTITKDLKFKQDKGVIYVVEKRHIKTILEVLGYTVDLEITKSDKENAVPKINLRIQNIAQSKLDPLLKNSNIKYIVFDSISQPLKTAFPGGRIQFPSRADATVLWLGRIIEMADNYDVAIYTTAHEALDPTNPYDTPHVRGPLSLMYGHKIILYLQPSKSKKFNKIKKLWVTRFFNVEGWSKFSILQLTDKGYEDVEITEEELKKAVRRLKKKTMKGETEAVNETEDAEEEGGVTAF